MFVDRNRIQLNARWGNGDVQTPGEAPERNIASAGTPIRENGPG